MNDEYRYSKERQNQPTRETAQQPAETGAKTEFHPRKGTIANAAMVKVRKSPDGSADVITRKHKDDDVLILGVAGGYYKIRISDEVSGFILKEFVQEA